MKIVVKLPCFQVRDDAIRISNRIREERRLGREANPVNKVAVGRAVDHTPTTVDMTYR